MRYRLVVLMLLLLLPVLSVMHLLAAPAPDPYGVLDIGPPPKGETAEAYRKDQIDGYTFPATLSMVWSDPVVRKLPSVARFKDARPWLAKNLRVTPENGDRHLRLTFRGGTRSEQVTILNAFLRVDLYWQAKGLKFQEKCLRSLENSILELEQSIKSSRNQQEAVSYQVDIDELRSTRILERRAEINRRKQLSVVKRAR